MKKRLLSTLLAVCMVLALLPGMALAEDQREIPTEYGTAEISLPEEEAPKENESFVLLLGDVKDQNGQPFTITSNIAPDCSITGTSNSGRKVTASGEIRYEEDGTRKIIIPENTFAGGTWTIQIGKTCAVFNEEDATVLESWLVVSSNELTVTVASDRPLTVYTNIYAVHEQVPTGAADPKVVVACDSSISDKEFAYEEPAFDSTEAVKPENWSVRNEDLTDLYPGLTVSSVELSADKKQATVFLAGTVGDESGGFRIQAEREAFTGEYVTEALDAWVSVIQMVEPDFAVTPTEVKAGADEVKVTLFPSNTLFEQGILNDLPFNNPEGNVDIDDCFAIDAGSTGLTLTGVAVEDVSEPGGSYRNAAVLTFTAAGGAKAGALTITVKSYIIVEAYDSEPITITVTEPERPVDPAPDDEPDYDPDDDYDPPVRPSRPDPDDGPSRPSKPAEPEKPAEKPAEPETPAEPEAPVQPEMPAPQPAPAPQFADVAPSAWYSEAAGYVSANGIMTGTGDGVFSPDAQMTRAMLWTVLGRLDGAEVSAAAGPWYAGAQAWCVEKGVSDGANPNGNITRQELVTMLWRYAGSPAASADLTAFTDASAVSGWAAGAVEWAVSAGLLQGSAGALNPAGTATRAEVAAILMRFCRSAK